MSLNYNGLTLPPDVVHSLVEAMQDEPDIHPHESLSAYTEHMQTQEPDGVSLLMCVPCHIDEDRSAQRFAAVEASQ